MKHLVSRACIAAALAVGCASRADAPPPDAVVADATDAVSSADGAPDAPDVVAPDASTRDLGISDTPDAAVPDVVAADVVAADVVAADVVAADVVATDVVAADVVAADVVAADVVGSDAPTAPVTRAWSGHALYAGRRPDVARMAWGPLVRFYAQDFSVVSMYGAPPRVLDTARTRAGSGDPGAFTLRVRASPDDTDVVIVTARSDDARGVAFGVADPGFPAGAWPYDSAHGRPADPTSPRWWSWRWRVDALPASGELVIDEPMGSGAAFVHDLLGVASRTLAPRFATPMRTVVAWLGAELDSACGPVACYDDRAVDVQGQLVEGQLWFPGTSLNQSYYAASTVLHEVGHHAMASWAALPHEGGAHYLGATSTPGLAWSEGFAHWFSSDLRGDSTHFDRQLVRTSGTPSVVTLSKDLSLRTWSSNGSLGAPVRARPAAGLLQPLDEDDIAASLWSLDDARFGAPIFLSALAHPRMQRASSFYGYRRVGDGVVVPVFPDYLDALVCAGLDASRVRDVTQPSRYYPYPDAANPPRCASEAESPLAVSWIALRSRGDEDLVEARVHLRAAIAAPVAAVVLPEANTTLAAGGDLARTIAAGTVGEVSVGRWWVRRGGGIVVRADASTRAWRVRAESAWPIPSVSVPWRPSSTT